MFLNRVFGKTPARKFLSPISFVGPRTTNVTLGVSVRFSGQISNSELRDLQARFVSGEYVHHLQFRSAVRNMGTASFMKCWTMDSLPRNGGSLQLHLAVASSEHEVAVVSIPWSENVLTRPILQTHMAQKRYAARILAQFIDRRLGVEETLETLHGICEDVGDTDEFYDFELLYYAQDELSRTGKQSYWLTHPSESIENILRQTAAAWIGNFVEDNRDSSDAQEFPIR